jgi:hypothetical protein
MIYYNLVDSSVFLIRIVPTHVLNILVGIPFGILFGTVAVSFPQPGDSSRLMAVHNQVRREDAPRSGGSFQLNTRFPSWLQHIWANCA